MSRTIVKYLTGSRITLMLEIYNTIDNILHERKTDRIDEDELFRLIMKRTRGHINPKMVKDELVKIQGEYL